MDWCTYESRMKGVIVWVVVVVVDDAFAIGSIDCGYCIIKSVS
jgi:hypothetical protein